MIKKTKIVGLKHRGANKAFLGELSGEKIIFILEPENQFDRFAIKCMAEGKHFGYITKKDSGIFTNLIRKSKSSSIKIISFDEYNVDIEVKFDVPQDGTQSSRFTFERIEDGNASGIYKILFRQPSDGQPACYIGQSRNINRRLKLHYAELERNIHHNSVLQDAWNDNYKNFDNKIIEKCPPNMDELEKQIWLFRKEADSIEKSRIFTANRIDADLVLTKDATLKLKGIVKESVITLKERRKAAVSTKELVGQEIINSGIIKEESVLDGWQSTVATVKASNILTWLNKTRFGRLGYRPNIDRSNPRYDELKRKLDLAHNKVKNIDREIKYVDEFFKTLHKKGKYDTCKIESLEKFLEIIESIYKPKSETSQKTIKCPNCSKKLRIPSDRRVKFTCPSCSKSYIIKVTD